MKTKIELKDEFNGANSLLFQQSVLDLSKQEIDITPEFDIPTTVDSLQITQDDPTVNHYKVIGLDGDWTSSATLGDTSVQFTCPTKHSDIIEMCWGKSAVKRIKANLNSGNKDLDGTYSGISLMLNKKKIYGSMIIVNEEQTQIMVLSGVALWAKPLYDNPGTNPFAIQLTGTLENAGNQQIAFLSKGDGVVSLTYATDAATTRLTVAQKDRKEGLVITYNTGSATVKEKYCDTRFTDAEWKKDDNWEAVV